MTNKRTCKHCGHKLARKRNKTTGKLESAGVFARREYCDRQCYIEYRRATPTLRQSDKRLYWVWQAMLDRCTNPNAQCWSIYGGRGIQVCERWQSYDAFYEDMGPRPKGLTLERIDNDGPYSPENCRWATVLEQAQNKRTCIYVDINGERLVLREFCRRHGLNYGTIKSRISRGWSVIDAVSKPVARAA